MTTPDISDRIRGLLDKKQGKTQAALARFCGVSTAAVAQWVHKGGISETNIQKAAEFFNVSADFLRTGKTAAVRAYFPEDNQVPPGYFAIPEYSLVLGADPGKDAEPEWKELHESTPLIKPACFFHRHHANPTRCRQARVLGDSMEPFIESGDRVIFEESYSPYATQMPVIDGEVYVIAIDGAFKVKRLSKIRNGILVSSDNERYSDEKYEREELNRLRIYGRVLSFERESRR